MKAKLIFLLTVILSLTSCQKSLLSKEITP